MSRVPHEQYCLYCKLNLHLKNQKRMLKEFPNNIGVQRLVGEDIAEMRRHLTTLEPCYHLVGLTAINKGVFPINIWVVGDDE